MKDCRRCNIGTMIEKETTQDLTVKGKTLHVRGLQHFECGSCGAQVETVKQIDHNSVLIKESYEKATNVNR
jgi:YgiT-type zinc finger domain-containing protein